MSTSINLILLLALGAAAIFVIRKMRSHHKVEHIVPKDPKAQSVYENTKHHEDEKKSLTLQEKVELSWEFLINITEKVMKKFSKKDQKTVHQAGEIFSNNGMKYQHNVNQEVRVIQVQERGRQATKVKNKSKSEGRSR